jgi:TRAP-type C4-dicarboxylate transport system permease small subunit
MTDYDMINLLVLIAGGLVIPLALAVHVFLTHSREYRRWDRLAAVILCLGAIAWGGFQWVVLNWRSFHLTPNLLGKLVRVRGLLAGVCIGIALSISLAHAYRKKADKGEQPQSSNS